MSLSDTCFNSLDLLRNDFVEYSGMNYPIEDFSLIISAMFDIAAVQAKNDLPPNAENESIIRYKNYLVIPQILKIAREANKDITSLLSKVLLINIKLKDSLDWIISNQISIKVHAQNTIDLEFLLNQMILIKKTSNT